MNFNTITRAMGRTKVKAIHAAPSAMTVAGVVSMGASVVVAVKRSKSAEPVYERLHTELGRVKEVREAFGEDHYSKQDHITDLTRLYFEAAKGYLKAYWPAIALSVAGAGLVFWSHGILKGRNKALGAALMATTQAFAKYRQSVADEVGEERERELAMGRKVEKKDEDILSVDPTDMPKSPYAVFFDDDVREWQPQKELNLAFLQNQERWLNDRLRHKGYLFLNDVYDALGIKRTKIGQIVGWVWDEKFCVGDNFVDFGLFSGRSSNVNFDLDDHQIYLDFNVQGPIIDLIDQIEG